MFIVYFNSKFYRIVHIPPFLNLSEKFEYHIKFAPLVFPGNNMLFIGMIGPKGPCEELCVKHNPGSPYKITYLVKERGDYMLAVKWGEEHIPGSPFYVKVE